MSGVRTGRCLCGRLRYEARGAGSAATLCHCESCRRAAGSPAVAWITFRADAFSWTRGAPRLFRSSPAVSRGFCEHCGTPVTYAHDDEPDWIDVTVGSLDAPADVAPADHTWTEDRLAWMTDLERLPALPRSRRAG